MRVLLSAPVVVLATVIAVARGPVMLDAAPLLALLPAEACDAAADRARCRAAGPKEWLPEERQIVGEALQRLSAHELARGIVAAAVENGYSGLRRYVTHTEADREQRYVPTYSPGFVLFGTKTIGMTDAFFQTAHLSDPIAGYRFGDLMLLHELVHAYDDQRVSIDREFTARSGWRLRDERWVYAYPVHASTYHGVFAETLTLYALGKPAQAWARSRSFATTLPFPVPTIQSLASPGESFADVLAHLILDVGAASYLKPDLVDYFKRDVFPMLMEKGRQTP